ncbi:MAG: aminotransferase, partial [Clostridia bacterium]|nr:aminotransferase [Clostridia bacterium]
TIGYDKINMLRHVKYLKDAEGVRAHMRRHADILRPKFDCVLNTFERELGGLGIASWGNPRGGYFISLDVADGCAKRVFNLMSEAGITLTDVGATYPYGKDPHDRNLRIAPSYPTVEELQKAIDVLCVCVKLAAAEKYLEA